MQDEAESPPLLALEALLRWNPGTRTFSRSATWRAEGDIREEMPLELRRYKMRKAFRRVLIVTRRTEDELGLPHSSLTADIDAVIAALAEAD